MKKEKREGLIMVVCGVIMVATLAISVLLVPKKTATPANDDDVTIGGAPNLDGYEESDLVIENLPFIRLNYYDEDTNERYGLMITFDGSIYRYGFNEINVTYPASDRFIVNQTIYFDNIVDEVGNIEQEDLELLRIYTEGIKYEYESDVAVFDTIGNSISVTNYGDESNIVLLNSEGIKNTNPNTDFILAILAKYNISL